MPLPAIQHNTPSAGSITWPALGMQYMGLSFNISSGNTNQKYVIWKWNGGAPSLITANTVPYDLTEDDKVLIINHLGKGSFIDFNDRIEGSLLVDGTVVAEAIAANAIQAQHIEANAISAGHIGANVIQAKHVAAGMITADKLSVGTVSDNAVVNGSFEDALTGTLVGWEISAQTAGTITPVTGVASSGAVSIQFDATSTTSNLRLRQSAPQFIPVSAASGRKYYVSARMGVSVATTVGNYLRVNWYDANKVLLTSGGTSDVRSNAALTTTFTLYEGQVTPPATARYMGIEILLVNPNVVTKLYLDEVTVHEVTMSVQIGDGQVTAAKITANTITADRIAAGAITVDKLAITDQQNYVRDPGLEFNGAGWSLPTGGTVATIADPRIDGTKALQIVGGSTTRDATTGSFPVREGDWYYASCYVRSTGTASTSSGDVHLGATIVLTGTNQYSWPRLTGLPANQVPTTWTRWEGTMQMPVGARSLQLRPSVRAEVANGTFQFDDFQLRRMNGGELIVDGAVYAEKIAANAVSANHIGSNVITANHLGANIITAKHVAANVITGDMIGANVIYGKHIDANVITSEMILANAIGAEEIAANSIYAQHIYTGAVTADAIAANAVTANHIFVGAVTGEKIEANAINGKTITGATVQTAESGARVVMDNTGLKAWDAAGNNYLLADEDGLTMEGLIQVKTFTDFATPEPMTAYVGNKSVGNSKNADGTYKEIEAGLHFKLNSLDPEYRHPRVISDTGRDITMAAGNATLGGSTYTEARVSVDHRTGVEVSASDYGHTVTLDASTAGSACTIYLGGNSLNSYADKISMYADDGIEFWDNVTISSGKTFNGVDVNRLVATQVTWANGWTNFGAGYGNLQAKEIMPGVVLLQGMAKAPATGRTDGMIIGTLPAALRPNRTQNMPLTIRTGQAMPNANQPGLVQIATNGNIHLFCEMTYISYANFSNSYFLNSP